MELKLNIMFSSAHCHSRFTYTFHKNASTRWKREGEREKEVNQVGKPPDEHIQLWVVTGPE